LGGGKFQRIGLGFLVSSDNVTTWSFLMESPLKALVKNIVNSDTDVEASVVSNSSNKGTHLGCALFVLENSSAFPPQKAQHYDS
jgi:hypothetical protein